MNTIRCVLRCNHCGCQLIVDVMRGVREFNGNHQIIIDATGESLKVDGARILAVLHEPSRNLNQIVP